MGTFDFDFALEIDKILMDNSFKEPEEMTLDEFAQDFAKKHMQELNKINPPPKKKPWYKRWL